MPPAPSEALREAIIILFAVLVFLFFSFYGCKTRGGRDDEDGGDGGHYDGDDDSDERRRHRRDRTPRDSGDGDSDGDSDGGGDLRTARPEITPLLPTSPGENGSQVPPPERRTNVTPEDLRNVARGENGTAEPPGGPGGGGDAGVSGGRELGHGRTSGSETPAVPPGTGGGGERGGGSNAGDGGDGTQPPLRPRTSVRFGEGGSDALNVEFSETRSEGDPQGSQRLSSQQPGPGGGASDNGPTTNQPTSGPGDARVHMLHDIHHDDPAYVRSIEELAAENLRRREVDKSQQPPQGAGRHPPVADYLADLLERGFRDRPRPDESSIEHNNNGVGKSPAPSNLGFGFNHRREFLDDLEAGIEQEDPLYKDVGRSGWASPSEIPLLPLSPLSSPIEDSRPRTPLRSPPSPAPLRTPPPVSRASDAESRNPEGVRKRRSHQPEAEVEIVPPKTPEKPTKGDKVKDEGGGLLNDKPKEKAKEEPSKEEEEAERVRIAQQKKDDKRLAELKEKVESNLLEVKKAEKNLEKAKSSGKPKDAAEAEKLLETLNEVLVANREDLQRLSEAREQKEKDREAAEKSKVLKEKGKEKEKGTEKEKGRKREKGREEEKESEEEEEEDPGRKSKTVKDRRKREDKADTSKKPKVRSQEPLLEEEEDLARVRAKQRAQRERQQEEYTQQTSDARQRAQRDRPSERYPDPGYENEDVTARRQRSQRDKEGDAAPFSSEGRILGRKENLRDGAKISGRKDEPPSDGRKVGREDDTEGRGNGTPDKREEGQKRGSADERLRKEEDTGKIGPDGKAERESKSVDADPKAAAKSARDRENLKEHATWKTVPDSESESEDEDGPQDGTDDEATDRSQGTRKKKGSARAEQDVGSDESSARDKVDKAETIDPIPEIRDSVSPRKSEEEIIPGKPDQMKSHMADTSRTSLSEVGEGVEGARQDAAATDSRREEVAASGESALGEPAQVSTQSEGVPTSPGSRLPVSEARDALPENVELDPSRNRGRRGLSASFVALNDSRNSGIDKLPADVDLAETPRRGPSRDRDGAPDDDFFGEGERAPSPNIFEDTRSSKAEPRKPRDRSRAEQSEYKHRRDSRDSSSDLTADRSVPSSPTERTHDVSRERAGGNRDRSPDQRRPRLRDRQVRSALSDEEDDLSLRTYARGQQSGSPARMEVARARPDRRGRISDDLDDSAEAPINSRRAAGNNQELASIPARQVDSDKNSRKALGQGEPSESMTLVRSDDPSSTRTQDDSQDLAKARNDEKGSVYPDEISSPSESSAPHSAASSNDDYFADRTAPPALKGREPLQLQDSEYYPEHRDFPKADDSREPLQLQDSEYYPEHRNFPKGGGSDETLASPTGSEFSLSYLATDSVSLSPTAKSGVSPVRSPSLLAAADSPLLLQASETRREADVTQQYQDTPDNSKGYSEQDFFGRGFQAPESDVLGVPSQRARRPKPILNQSDPAAPSSRSEDFHDNFFGNGNAAPDDDTFATTETGSPSSRTRPEARRSDNDNASPDGEAFSKRRERPEAGRSDLDGQRRTAAVASPEVSPVSPMSSSEVRIGDSSDLVSPMSPPRNSGHADANETEGSGNRQYNDDTMGAYEERGSGRHSSEVPVMQSQDSKHDEDADSGYGSATEEPAYERRAPRENDVDDPPSDSPETLPRVATPPPDEAREVNDGSSVQQDAAAGLPSETATQDNNTSSSSERRRDARRGPYRHEDRGGKNKGEKIEDEDGVSPAVQTPEETDDPKDSDVPDEAVPPNEATQDDVVKAARDRRDRRRQPRKQDTTDETAGRDRPPKDPSVERETSPKQPAAEDSINPLNPWRMFQQLLRCLTNAPIYSLFTTATMVLYIMGSRQIYAFLTLTATSSSASLTKRDSTPLDLSLTETLLSKFSTDASPMAVFAILNLWQLLSIPLIVALVQMTIARAEGGKAVKLEEEEEEADHWYKHPVQSFANLFKKLASTVAMEAELYGLSAFWRKCSLWTLLRTTLFAIEMAAILLLFRQCLSLLYMVGSGSTKAYSSSFDLTLTETIIASLAKSTTPTLAFMIANVWLILILPLIAWSWSSLLHPKPKGGAAGLHGMARLKDGFGKMIKVLSMPKNRRIRNALKLVVVIILVCSFAGSLIYFQQLLNVVETDLPETKSASGSAAIIGACAIFALYTIPMAFVLVELAKYVDKLKGWANCGSKTGDST
ncbi:hypothetical protein P7C73_g5350, partial [Tremellales sp. Uapishka_1]